MTASPLDEWTERDVAKLEEWRMDLGASLLAALSLGTTVEFLTYREMQNQMLRRFVIAYVGESRVKVEINYPEPIEDIVERLLTEISNAGMSNTEMEARV